MTVPDQRRVRVSAEKLVGSSIYERRELYRAALVWVDLAL